MPLGLGQRALSLEMTCKKAQTQPASYQDFGCSVLRPPCKPLCCARLQQVTRADAALNGKDKDAENGLSNPIERHVKTRKGNALVQERIGYFAH
ncbi:hypothetical protein [Sinorhizobium meliloti]|uniref:hypothetical protein n=1 Tax=Rhizobium meliloti TaxID=382 RepID=UPI000FD554CB|nr:hypothetical protein [Sinorhizobium meliloti]MQW25297.1 hypothetical protein [Sinorhizobium meliloti]RVJ65219.1 hypothetical protein CN171_33640 [Sinorhizobium meliloti]